MAELTAGTGFVLFVTVHTTRHRRHIRRSSQHFHLSDFPVADFTFHSGFKVRAVVPKTHADTT